MSEKDYAKGLKALGNKSEYSTKVDASLLEIFPKPSGELFYVTFTQLGEFTSLCPKTGQPDFADIKILYRPGINCVESKSLKLYLGSYRETGGFGEDIVNRIADDLYMALDPFFVIVKGNFKPRGGIAWETTAIRFVEPGREKSDGDDYVLSEIDKLQISLFK